MSPTFRWSAPIPVPDKATIVVREALLPMLLWPSVQVIREVEEELTLVDRFMVEAALAMPLIATDDIVEVTGMPAEVVSRIASRLIGVGLLTADGDGFMPAPSAATMLPRLSVPVRRPDRLTFLYLPQGDDLIAFKEEKGRTEPPMLHRLTAETNFPVPMEIAEHGLAAFLLDRIVTGRVVGMPEDVVDVSDEGTLIPINCPAYRVSGAVMTKGGQVSLQLAVPGTKQKLTVRDADGQGAYWAARSEWAGAAADDWAAAGGMVDATRIGPADWSFTLDGQAATAAAEAGVELSRPAGLSIIDDDCVTYVDATFTPADHEARQVFALRQAMLKITSTVLNELQVTAVSDAATAARGAYRLAENDLTDAAVLAQLWRDRHYQHVYAMRRDFVRYG